MAACIVNIGKVRLTLPSPTCPAGCRSLSRRKRGGERRCFLPDGRMLSSVLFPRLMGLFAGEVAKGRSFSHHAGWVAELNPLHWNFYFPRVAPPGPTASVLVYLEHLASIFFFSFQLPAPVPYLLVDALFEVLQQTLPKLRPCSSTGEPSRSASWRWDRSSQDPRNNKRYHTSAAEAEIRGALPRSNSSLGRKSHFGPLSLVGLRFKCEDYLLADSSSLCL